MIENTDKVIAKLTEELDAETVAELVAHFFSDTSAQIVALREAAERADFAIVRFSAHSLAGSSSTFGLEEMRNAALALERSALAAEHSAISAKIDALAEAYAIAIPKLEQIIQKKKAPAS